MWSNGSGTEGEHKELTTPQAQYPLVSSKTTVLGVPTGEGAPSKSEGGGGVFYMGPGEGFPSRFGQRPRSLYFMASSS